MLHQENTARNVLLNPWGRSRSTRRGPAWLPLLLLAWFLGVSIPLTYLMAAHWLPLPLLVSAREPAWTGAMREPGRVEGGDAGAARGWRMVHVLAADCGCSARVASYLARRGRINGCDEQAWVVGMDTGLEQMLRREGYPVRNVSAEELERRHGVSGGPWLLVLGPGPGEAYSGGHAARRPRDDADMQDLEIWRRVRAGEEVDPLPVFGCATSSRLREALDPLGLKYRREP